MLSDMFWKASPTLRPSFAEVIMKDALSFLDTSDISFSPKSALSIKSHLLASRTTGISQVTCIKVLIQSIVESSVSLRVISQTIIAPSEPR